jgi:hypothetical protein
MSPALFNKLQTNKQTNKMRNTQKAAVLLLLLAGAFAGSAPIKTRLGQLNAKTLAQVQGGNGGGNGGGDEGAGG